MELTLSSQSLSQAHRLRQVSFYTYTNFFSFRIFRNSRGASLVPDPILISRAKMKSTYDGNFRLREVSVAKGFGHLRSF